MKWIYVYAIDAGVIIQLMLLLLCYLPNYNPQKNVQSVLLKVLENGILRISDF